MEQALLDLLYTRFPKGILKHSCLGYQFWKYGEEKLWQNITAPSIQGILEVALTADWQEDEKRLCEEEQAA